MIMASDRVLVEHLSVDNIVGIVRNALDRTEKRGASLI